jgi:hypothetical protein
VGPAMKICNIYKQSQEIEQESGTHMKIPNTEDYLKRKIEVVFHLEKKI